MLNQIKEMADAAVKLQNKLNMEATLKNISAMCSAEAEAPTGGEWKKDAGPIEAGDVLVGADGKEFKIDEVVAPEARSVADYGLSISIPHEADPELAAVVVKPAKKGGKK